MWDGDSVSVTGPGEPERVQALDVTDGTLSLLRVQPAIGRRFTAEDDSPKAPSGSCWGTGTGSGSSAAMQV